MPARQLSANYQNVLRKLQNAITNEAKLTPEEKARALDRVRVLAEAWPPQQPGSIPKRGRIAIGFLQVLSHEIPEATDFRAACGKLLPAIAKLLSK